MLYAPVTTRGPLKLQGTTIISSWSDIISVIRSDSYKEVLQLGDTVILNLRGNNEIFMRLVGFDLDELADGSGKARTTWIANQALNDGHPMLIDKRTVLKNIKETFARKPRIGWDGSELQRFLNDDVMKQLPKELSSDICCVVKYSKNTWGGLDETSDWLWVPSEYEVGVFRHDSPEKGPRYYSPGVDLTRGKPLDNVNDRIGHYTWWLRTAEKPPRPNVTAYFKVVERDGRWTEFCQPGEARGVVLGFCL